MSSQTIRIIIILATISIIGITITQVFWVKQAFNQEEEGFHRDVNLALNEVAQDFFQLSNSTSPTANPIIRLTGNYYVVMVNGQIDANLLEVLLKRKFSVHNLNTDFEYGIYDCSTENMVYGNYVSSTPNETHKTNTILPIWDETDYYFGVHFPEKGSYLVNRMGFWMFSTIVLLVVILFFAYTLFVILKQKRLSEVQKDFINNMTHEFRTPISTIEIASDVLKNPGIRDDPGRLLKYATIIDTENKRLKNQVDKVLQIASLDRGMIQLNKENLDIQEIIKKVIDQVDNSLPSGSILTDFQAKNHQINVDKVHITNIIYNLLDNAVKYSPGDPKIIIETMNTSDQFEMNFRDNGLGISREHQENIFGKFYRIPTGNVQDTRGFGIGLHYVRLIVAAHGGSISLQSEVGQGSNFKINLPL